jgi:hypothetical protein
MNVLPLIYTRVVKTSQVRLQPGALPRRESLPDAALTGQAHANGSGCVPLPSPYRQVLQGTPGPEADTADGCSQHYSAYANNLLISNKQIAENYVLFRFCRFAKNIASIRYSEPAHGKIVVSWIEYQVSWIGYR